MTRAKAKSQLEAFPSSKNQKERQSPRVKCVVAVRMLGREVDKLDKEAKRINDAEGRTWNQATRTTVIERALQLYFQQLSAVQSMADATTKPRKAKR